jgi:hypothetical protein
MKIMRGEMKIKFINQYNYRGFMLIKWMDKRNPIELVLRWG